MDKSADDIIGAVFRLLQDLRCQEPHGTGLGSCRCNTNNLIDEIEDYLIDEDAPWFDEDRYK